jgi:hypothetical protein
MYRTTTMAQQDRDSLTPISPLSSRLELEKVIRDTRNNTKETRGNTHDIGTLVASVARVERVGLATAAAIAAHIKEEQGSPRMRAGEIRAWFGGVTAVLAVVVGGLTQWRVQQAGAESRAQSQVAASQAYDLKADAEREKVAQRVAEDTARRTAEEVRRAIREGQIEAERRALMRVPRR